MIGSLPEIAQGSFFRPEIPLAIQPAIGPPAPFRSPVRKNGSWGVVSHQVDMIWDWAKAVV